MAVRLAPFPKFRAFTVAGVPLVGGKLYSYAAGTSTPLSTYTDSTGGTPNANPTILDAAGEANVWLTEGVGYKLVLKTSTDSELWSVDNVLVPLTVTTGLLPTGWTATKPTGVFAASNNAAVLTLPGFFEAGKIYLGVSLVVDTQFGNGNGLVTLSLGTPEVIDRYGNAIALTAGATNGNRKAGLFTPMVATDLLLSGEGGTFAATGQATVTAHVFTIA